MVSDAAQISEGTNLVSADGSVCDDTYTEHSFECRMPDIADPSQVPSTKVENAGPMQGAGGFESGTSSLECPPLNESANREYWNSSR